MKKSRFTDSQILAVLKQAEAGTPIPQLCREHGISSATFYKWQVRTCTETGSGSLIERVEMNLPVPLP